MSSRGCPGAKCCLHHVNIEDIPNWVSYSLNGGTSILHSISNQPLLNLRTWNEVDCTIHFGGAWSLYPRQHCRTKQVVIILHERNSFSAWGKLKKIPLKIKYSASNQYKSVSLDETSIHGSWEGYLHKLMRNTSWVPPSRGNYFHDRIVRLKYWDRLTFLWIKRFKISVRPI